MAFRRQRRPRPKRRSTQGGKGRFRYLALTIGGWTFMVLGVLGLFLPILQGVLFLAVGTVMLSLVSPRIRSLRIKLGRRYPQARKHMDAAREWMNKKFGKKHGQAKPGS
jgi:hypothetical protein